MKQKPKTTGMLNKAEKFVLQLCLEKVHFNIDDLRIPVAEKLGLNTDGFKYADVPTPKLPPEYQNAIDAAMKISGDLQEQHSAL